MLRVKDMCNEDGILTLNQFKNKVGNYSRVFFDYYIIYNALKNIDINQQIDDNHHVEEVTFRGEKVRNIDRKITYTKIRKMTSCYCVNVWQNKYGINVEEKHWKNIYLTCKESKLQNLQWKIMHNISASNIYLKKIGIKASTKCDLCEEEDYTEHKFYQCQSVKPLWDLIESLIQIRFKQDFKITEEIAMLGYIGGNEKIRKKINTTILIAKLCIQKFRFRTIKNLLEIWEKESTIRKI